MSLIADTQQTPLKNESFMKAHLASTTLGSSTKIANLNESGEKRGTPHCLGLCSDAMNMATKILNKTLNGKSKVFC